MSPASLRRLGPNARGALWMLAAAASFSLVDAIVKHLGQTLDALQLSFLRNLFGGIVVLPFLLGSGLAAFRTARPLGHLGRAFAGYASMTLSFYAVTHMALADAVTFSFTRPLFMVVLAVLLLGERIRWRRTTATAVGFCGVLVMAPPLSVEIELAPLAAMSSAFFGALVGVALKKLSATERPEAIILYYAILGSLLALPGAIIVWRTPALLDLPLLAAIGAIGALGQYFAIRGYRLAEATAVEPVDFSRLVFALFFGLVIFGELPGIMSLVGAAIIIASNLYITHREAQLRRATSRPHDPPESAGGP